MISIRKFFRGAKFITQALLDLILLDLVLKTHNKIEILLSIKNVNI